jgi:protein phosphatase
MRGKMDCHGQTDAGRVRESNEDQFLLADLNKSMLIHQTSLSLEDHTRLFGSTHGQLLLVADGMGGHRGGRRASTLAVEAVTHYVLNTMPWFFRLAKGQEADLNEELRASVEECQRVIETASAAEPERPTMGTTLTMAYLLWPRLYVVHAGDSRCCILRGNQLHQVTRDHTIAQRMVEQGALTAEQAEGSRWSHVLWNCIGGGTHELNPDVYKAQLQIGDTLLLCTDGLTKVVPEKEIVKILGEHRSAAETCRHLISAANAHGGPDNITVVVAHFRDSAAEPERALEEATAELEAPMTSLAEPAGEGTLEISTPA